MADPEMTDSTPAAAPEPMPAPRRSNPLWPVLGGLIAAGLGFALAQAVPGGWPIADTSAQDARIAALSAQVAELSARIEAMPGQAPADSGLAERVAALETRDLPPDLSQAVKALQTRVDQIAASSAVPGGVDAEALKALQNQVSALDPSSLSQQVEAAVRAAKDQLATATAEAEARTQDLAQSLAERAALRQLLAALDSGAPFAGALPDLSSHDLPAVLTDHAMAGLPSLQSLRQAFPDAARAALEAARRADMGGSWTQRITTFLQTQTGARSLTPRDGNDPDAILSRAESALAAGDLAVALSEIDALPEAARPALAPWRDQARLRLDAVQAVDALSRSLGP